jgi:hypothetical protein
VGQLLSEVQAALAQTPVPVHIWPAPQALAALQPVPSAQVPELEQRVRSLHVLLGLQLPPAPPQVGAASET